MTFKEFLDKYLGMIIGVIIALLVIIFGGSLFISIFKLTNIGEVITTFFANIIAASSFSGVALIILLFVFAGDGEVPLENRVILIYV